MNLTAHNYCDFFFIFSREDSNTSGTALQLDMIMLIQMHFLVSNGGKII